MMSLILNFALFFLVLFIVVPALMISIGFVRDHHHKHVDWHKDPAEKLAG